MTHPLDKDAEIARLTRANRTLRCALEEVRDELNDLLDVVDGPNGEQRPNKWMSLQTAVRFALGEVP